MSEIHCPQCETPLDRELNAGLCPKCLLAMGLSDADDVSGNDLAETFDSGSTASRFRGDQDLEFETGGKVFADYELLDEIARGGMGVVYRARDRKLGREVALKVILSGQFASTNDVRRFQLEAESAASLDHPGIVPIYEVGQHDGNHFFTMKLISGGSLTGKMKVFREDQRALVECLSDVAEALDYAHRRGILHRDIKPANILIDDEGRPVVTDLGLAKRTGSDSDLTGTGAIVGTPAYMPPEQASASKEVTTSADIYSIGAILYEGLTGHPPHQGESAVATLMLAAKGQIRPPSETDRKVDRTLELICMKCLATDPEDRYPSAGAFAKDLRSWLRGDAVSVRPKSFATVLGDMLADQLRSAIGAIVIGILGGLATGIPLYAGLARRLLSGEQAYFNVSRLTAEFPDAPIDNPWWLYLPAWVPTWGLLFGITAALFLGWVIRFLVRPSSTRQALALGLVAGLLMTIVQFGMYGVGAMWNTHAMSTAADVELLSQASLSSGNNRSQAIETIYEVYPGLRDLPADRQPEMLSQLVSVRIMLSSPPVMIACLSVCLLISTVYCVAGTVHAQRLFDQAFHVANMLLRYIEVAVLLTLFMVVASFGIFMAFGMVTDNGRVTAFDPMLLIPLTVIPLATVPGFAMKRWYVRWSIYIACGFLLTASSRL